MQNFCHSLQKYTVKNLIKSRTPWKICNLSRYKAGHNILRIFYAIPNFSFTANARNGALLLIIKMVYTKLSSNLRLRILEILET